MFLKGFALCLFSFLIWGFAPLFWKQAMHIPAEILLYHRVIFGNLILALLLIGKIRELVKLMFKNWQRFLTTSVLIGCNWFVFVWAIVNDKILDTSLGYYLNPFFSLLLGTIFLKEKLNRMQILAVVIAFCGVLTITYSIGFLPWVSVVLALTFALYGYIHKKSDLNSDASLYLETTILLPFFLGLNFAHPEIFNVYADPANYKWLIAGGLITVVPLLCFIQGVKYIPLSLVGILQFLAPSMTFYLAIFVYKETASPLQFIGFIFIWLAIILYISESFRKRYGKKRKTA